MQQLRKVSTPLLCAVSYLLGACIQHESAAEQIDFSGSWVDEAAPGAGGSNGDADMTPLDAEQQLPAYYAFMTTLKARGFTFMNFGDFWAADKATLPEQLIVLRHDVHHRDIRPAYAMHAIEHELKLAHAATYFVMLGFPKEARNAGWQQDYLDLIKALHTEGVDVQPHISPDDMYVSAYAPGWRKKSRSQLAAMTAGEYDIVSYGDGVEIVATPHDALDIRMMNVGIVELLRQYNQSWTQQTGLTPRYYASHGSNLALNHVLNNATILDQRELIASGVYEFDTYNTRVHEVLDDLTDNEQPDWMDHPESIAPGRYQLLAHPRLWEPDDTEMRQLREAEEAVAGEGGAPVN